MPKDQQLPSGRGDWTYFVGRIIPSQAPSIMPLQWSVSTAWEKEMRESQREQGGGRHQKQRPSGDSPTLASQTLPPGV